MGRVGSEPCVPDPGERLLLACDGGPSQSRLVVWPPPVEIVDRGGMYVLVDDGDDVTTWSYHWVPSPAP